MTIEIKSETIEDVITNLRAGAWQVPKFQREFVWNHSQIFELINSIFASRPIGMITLWAQPDENELPLEPISIPDMKGKPKHFSVPGVHPKKFYAILDGRQRCTALAMVFGGLSPDFGGRKFAGKYFLDASSQEEINRVVFKKKSEIEKEDLSTPNVCFSKGLFPLFPTGDDAGIQGQFLSYFMEINNPSNYPDNTLPTPVELHRRQQVLKRCYEGLTSTKLAVTIVPDTYSLDEICDIFETLNQTGTKVSTVDLIHAKIYQETNTEFDLREWIEELSQVPGTAGWASKDKRPELVAQFVTACYVALPKDERELPKVVAGKKREITSVKSADLLATPASHWRNVRNNEELFSAYFLDMQKCIAGGSFDMRDCPYPVSAAIYVALRWSHRFSSEEKSWGIEQLDILFRAFFWKNALSERYAQGFLSTMATDIVNLRSLLDDFSKYASVSEWSNATDAKLNGLMKIKPVQEDALIDLLTDVQRGAINSAFRLPIIISVRKDILSGEVISNNSKEFHHIYPKKWARSNMSGSMAELLSTDPSTKNYVDSVANLIPLTKASNLAWRDKVPGQVLLERGISFDDSPGLFEAAFIGEKCFEILMATPPDPKSFWVDRAQKMADQFVKLARVKA